MLNEIKSQIVNDKYFLEELYTLNTPAIVYNYNLLEAAITYVRKHIPGSIKLYYSIKANSNNDMLVYMKNHIDGLDVASIYEFEAGIKAGYSNISVTGPSFKPTDIEKVYNHNCLFDFNSISQLIKCEEFIKNKEIGVRIKIDNTPYSRFGIDIKDKEFQNFITINNIKIRKVHIHSGEKSPSSITEVCNYLKKVLNNEILRNVKTINLGGGITNLLINGEIKNFKNQLSEVGKIGDYEIILEPGRAISSLCGFLVTSVIAADISNSKKDVTLDSSAYNLFPWFLPRPISTDSRKEIITQNLWGNTCFEYDSFARDLNYPELDMDNKIIFYPVGAYSKNNHKTLHRIPYPNEYHFLNNKLTLIGGNYEYSRS